ncbi:MAG TPA: hypothetical protein DEG44_00650 [Candidatus Kerfeldbacteria bacterium]|nr:hypothetical protein [Candidatus Kerfeldbacteria bacterium]
MELAERWEQAAVATPDTIANDEPSWRQRWASFVDDARSRYQSWKKELYRSTDATLEKMADQYVETPTATYWQAAQRAVDTARRSLTLRSAMELGVRAALPVAEFSAQMTAKQFLVDIAIRQADCDALAKKYEAQGGVTAVESEAMKFANEVRQHFAELQKQTERMMPEQAEDKESFRQQHITAGVHYAEQLLQKVTIIPESNRQKILVDIRTHLDTEVFDPSRPSLFKAYEQATKRYKNSIQDIVERHVDVYQKRKARNLAMLTTGARWLTFGVESFVIGRASAAYRTVTANYDKALTQLPAHERTTGKRLAALAGGVRESLKQFALDDRFRLALRAQTDAKQTISAAVERLITPEQQAASDQEFAVDDIANALWKEFGQELQKRNVTEAELYGNIEDLAAFQGDRRQQLEHILRYRLLRVHRETIKATVHQFEHIYRQFNTNIATLGVLDQIDTRIEQLAETRVDIDQILGQLETAVDNLTVTTVSAHEPTAARPSIADYEATVPLPDEITSEVPPENTVTNITYVTAPGDSAWKIVSEHLEWYRQREDNPALTIPQAIDLLVADNHLAHASKLEIGQPLVIPSESLPVAMESEVVQPEVVTELWQQDKVMTPEMAVQAARGVDAHISNEHFVVGATRADLDALPVGHYIAVFGDRYSTHHGKTMAVHYDASYAVTVDESGVALARPLGDQAAEAIPLNELLKTERSASVRVFTTESAELKIDHGSLTADTWSMDKLAKIQFLQHDAVRVVAEDGTFCSKDIAGRFNLMAPHLAEQVGLSVLNADGQVTGVTVHAPMMAESMIAAGGKETATLKDYFTLNESGAHPTETVNSTDATYRYQLQHWIQEAGRSPLQVATFLYAGTHIQDIIAANRFNGGEPNSHGVTLLGEENHTFTQHGDNTLDKALAWNLGLSQSDLAQRGYLFESLGIEVNGVPVTNETDWLRTPVHEGDSIVVHDIALNHRFHGDRADTLVTLLVQSDKLMPVSIVQPNPEVVNAAMGGSPEFGSDFIVNNFVEVKTGQSLATVFADGGLSPDMWKAAEFTLVEQGIDPVHLKSGTLVPIFDEDSLAAHLDTIYERAEARLAAANDTEVYIVRPHDSMDHITGQWFDRARYSASEWSQLRDRVAGAVAIPYGNKEMPGDLYTQPYSVHEYHVQADAVLQLDANAIAQLERLVWQDRLAERIYLPETLPLATDAGVVETALPAEVTRLIDTVVDGNPEYGERVRTALALVYANEGMREIADKNMLSSAISWVNDHLPSRSATLDQLVAYSEYYTSRQALKDVAWSIKDSDWADASLDFAIAQGQAAEHSVSALHPVVGALEQVAGVSSAGLFQVRANNFVAEDDAAFQQFEQNLRNDPLMATAAAGEILYRNETVLDTYVSAFGDPQKNDEIAQMLALVNSYNGGPYKTMLGSLQERLLVFAQAEHLTLPIAEASGRGTDDTRAALQIICDRLQTAGKLAVAPDQIERDLSLLGTETVAFLRSETMQQLKHAYQVSTGEPLSILPQQQHLADHAVSFANYAYLATQAGAYDVITQYSNNTRLAKGDANTEYARSEAPWSLTNAI